MIFFSCVPARQMCCSSGCRRTQKDILPSATVLQWGSGQGRGRGTGQLLRMQVGEAGLGGRAKWRKRKLAAANNRLPRSKVDLL